MDHLVANFLKRTLTGDGPFSNPLVFLAPSTETAHSFGDPPPHFCEHSRRSKSCLLTASLRLCLSHFRVEHRQFLRSLKTIRKPATKGVDSIRASLTSPRNMLSVCRVNPSSTYSLGKIRNILRWFCKGQFLHSLSNKQIATARLPELNVARKGFFPNWARLGPWQLTFWVTYEHARQALGAAAKPKQGGWVSLNMVGAVSSKTPGWFGLSLLPSGALFSSLFWGRAPLSSQAAKECPLQTGHLSNLIFQWLIPIFNAIRISGGGKNQFARSLVKDIMLWPVCRVCRSCSCFVT